MSSQSMIKEIGIIIIARMGRMAEDIARIALGIDIVTVTVIEELLTSQDIAVIYQNRVLIYQTDRISVQYFET